MASTTVKILYVTVQFPVPSETFAAVEIRALRDLGMDVSIATLNPRPRNCNNLLRDRDLGNIQIDHNSVGSSLRGIGVALRRPRLLFRLLNEICKTEAILDRMALKSLLVVPRTLDLFNNIRRSPPDVLHLFWGHYPSLLGILVSEFIPKTLVSLSLSAYDLHSRFGPSIKLGKQVPVVLTISQANIPAIADLGITKDKINVVYHGVEVEGRIGNIPQKKRDQIVIAERLIPLKRTADSLRAFREVLNICPETSLLVLGDGPEKTKLMQLAKKLELGQSVRFLGHVSHRQVFEVLSDARVLLSMSSSERLPNTVKEAMLQNCICVVARTVGIEELINDTNSGFIVEQRDIQSAANAVVRCLKSWNDLSNLRSAAQSHILEHFGSRAVAQSRIEIWQKAIDRQNSK